MHLKCLNFDKEPVNKTPEENLSNAKENRMIKSVLHAADLKCNLVLS